MIYATEHNGGILQLNINSANDGAGTWPFINHARHSQAWNGGVTGVGSKLTAATAFDNLGNPIVIPDGFSNISGITFVPSQDERPGSYVTTWNGEWNCGFEYDNTKSTSGSENNIGSGTSGRFEFFPGADGRIFWNVNALGATLPTDFKFFHSDDETLIDAGEIWNPTFVDQLEAMNFGWLRFGVSWNATNISNEHLWVHRMPADFNWQFDTYPIPALDVGETTNSGSDYTLSMLNETPITHGEGRHVQFNVDNPAPLFACTLSHANPMVVTTLDGSGNPTAHGASVGDLWAFDNDPAITDGSAKMSPNIDARRWFVISATPDANTFQVTLPSGSAIDNSSDTVSAHVRAFKVTCLRETNGTYAPIYHEYGGPVCPDQNGPIGSHIGTVFWDEDCQVWWKFGSTRQDLGFIGDRYFTGSVAWENILDLCAKVGAHPHISVPAYSLFPRVTDYPLQLATFVKNWIETNNVTWMIPRFEAANEVWNGAFGFETTNVLQTKGLLARGDGDINQIYGEMVSKLGQVVSGVYGDDRSKYDVLVAFQTVGNPASQVARLTAANYVANGPAQDGFTQSPASDWATCGCIAQYWQPSAYGQALEATLNTAVQGGDQTAPGRYIDTAASGGIVTVDAVITIHAGYKTFLQAHGINKLCGYEGGYSPDINGTNTPIRIAGKGATSGQVYKGGIYHAAQSVYDGVMALADDSFKIDGLSVFLFAGPLPDNNAWTIQADIYQPVSDQCKSFALYNAGKRRYTVGVHG